MSVPSGQLLIGPSRDSFWELHRMLGRRRCIGRGSQKKGFQVFSSGLTVSVYFNFNRRTSFGLGPLGPKEVGRVLRGGPAESRHGRLASAAPAGPGYRPVELGLEAESQKRGDDESQEP